MIVSGFIARISEETFGSGVVLSIGSGAEYSFATVSCHVGGDDVNQVLPLRVSDAVEVRGKFDGVGFTQGVDLKNCQVQ